MKTIVCVKSGHLKTSLVIVIWDIAFCTAELRSDYLKVQIEFI